MNALRHFLLALQFFTRIPVTGALAGWVGYSPAMLRASAAYFPAVGLLVGLISAVLSLGLAQVLPATAFTPLVVAVAGTLLSVWITGAFHEDGLADVADGLGGSADRRRALEIMKDSRIGAFGAIALVLALGFKFALLALLASVDTWRLVAALVLAHAVSRGLSLVPIALLPHVGEAAGSKSKPLADRIAPVSLLIAAGLCLLAALVASQGVDVLGGEGAGLDAVDLGAALLAGGLALAWMTRLFARRLQGFTGDCLGATQQVCELAIYLALAIAS
jgi:adenosylcobinamide-GDP ribazoletransferase